MYKWVFVFSFIFFESLVCAGSFVNGLCRSNEELLYSFTLNRSRKSVCLCKEKEGAYLVYRFGTPDKIELQYPEKPDHTSWRSFIFYGEKRFGGKANAGFGDYWLSFENKHVRYRVYETWNDEDGSKEIGVEVTSNGKRIFLKGDTKSKEGTLLRLDDEAKKIVNSAEDEQ